MPTFNIVTCDGGGIRGVFSARLLDRLTEHVPTLLHEVSLFGGTSTGAILSAGLAASMSPSSLVDMYRTTAAAIFSRRWAGGLVGSRYRSEGLRDTLTATFGDKRLGDLSRWILVPALDLDAPAAGGFPRRAKAKFFDSISDANVRVVDCLLASSAAPTYFASHEGYVDGGLIANSPSIHAAAFALSRGIPASDLRVLSIGTGMSPSFIEGSPDWGALRWGPKIATLQIDSVSGVSDFIARQVLQDRYCRLDGNLERPTDLDEVDAIPELIRAADAVDLRPVIEWLQSSTWTATSPVPETNLNVS